MCSESSPAVLTAHVCSRDVDINRKKTGAHLHDPRGNDGQDEVEPDVGKDAPESGDEKHSQVFDFARLSLRNHPHAQADDHKHVEGGAPYDGAGPELPRIKVVPTDLSSHMHPSTSSCCQFFLILVLILSKHFHHLYVRNKRKEEPR